MRFDDIMTIAEASERFGRAASTLKQACLSGRLVEGEECRKSGGVLLVTKQGMERLYGKEQPKQAYYFAELQNAGSYRQAEKLKATSLRAAKREASMRQVFHQRMQKRTTYSYRIDKDRWFAFVVIPDFIYSSYTTT